MVAGSASQLRLCGFRLMDLTSENCNNSPGIPDRWAYRNKRGKNKLVKQRFEKGRRDQYGKHKCPSKNSTEVIFA